MKHVAILGAGPIGIEAALAAAERGLPFTLYEAAPSVAGNVRTWGHVRLFTPWAMVVSARARAALASAGREVPDGDGCPTGRELVERVLEPIAALPEIAERLRTGTRVVEVGREGLLKSDEIGTRERASRPFRLLLRDTAGKESIELADVVLDCTGTYDHPNALGAGGINAPGEAEASDFIIRRIPDLEAPTFTGGAHRWTGLRVLLVGAGHSAQTVARDLAELVEREPDTHVTWAIRSTSPTFGAIPDDALPERRALVDRARELAADPPSRIDVRLGRAVDRLETTADGIVVTLCGDDGPAERVTVDRIVSMTGSVGDARIYRQLQVHECYATSGPMRLAAALLASTSADCLSQESHGAETLRTPEPGFFIAGMKSYGRNNTFLVRVGWQQVDEIFSLIDIGAADGAANGAA